MRLYALVEAGDLEAIDILFAEEDARRALEVYALKMERKRDTGERMDAVCRALIGQ